MLKQLKIENFTVFPKADLQFASGLNVIVGENGCGKSHLLKLAYSFIAKGSVFHGNRGKKIADTEFRLLSGYADKLVNVFHIESLHELIKKQPNKINNKGFRAKLNFSDSNLDCTFNYYKHGKLGGELDLELYPKEWNPTIPVFMPTRELLTIYPGFVSIYESHYLEFDETYRDTCILLGLPLLKGKREQQAKEMLKPLEKAMGGKALLENGRFYLSTPNKGKIEISMVAEGQRKLAMLAQLIANGSLLESGYLFWDEPESNLNPKLIKVIAKVILNLCNSGIQVFIASHSLFLLRELEILSKHDEFKQVESRYFALRLEDNESVEVEQGDTLYDLQTLVLLDEQLLQSDRFMELGD